VSPRASTVEPDDEMHVDSSGSWFLDDGAVIEAIELVDRSGVVPQLAAWRQNERRRLGRHPGGAPERFAAKALCVAMFLAVLHDRPQHLTTYVDVLWRRISPKMRARLGVPEPPDAEDRLAWLALERDVATRFHGLLDAIDPSDLPKNRRLGPEAFQAAIERKRADHQLTDEILTERHERLAWVLNALLEVSYTVVPRDVRRNWKGSVAVDATPVPAFARQEHREKGKARARVKRPTIEHSADPDAGYYIRISDHQGRPAPRSERNLRAAFWSYEATIVVVGNDNPDTDPLFPNLVMGMAPVHRPGSDIAENAMTALTSIAARGHPRRLLAGDRAYTNCKPNKFQLPARALGYAPVFDYKIDQLGVQESYGGAKLIEGAWYCPAIPDSLAEATRDNRTRCIDEETWKARIEERRAYLMRPKANPDDTGDVRLMCPASPAAPTAGCRLKPASIRQAPTKTRVQVTDELRTNPPAVCCQNSVTFPPEPGAKYLQPLHYGAPKWRKIYATLRNAVEGANGIAKDGAHAAIGDPTRRRVRGVAAQSIFAALAFMSTNIRMIRSFLREARLDPKGVLRRPRPPRRKAQPLKAWTPVVIARAGAPPP
jgi:hypothetical protein